jgi:glycosyltransferase involved in cell wall biosynthesis
MAMATPRVSVCVPTFNHRLMIRPALESVLAQDYPDVEIIVADDGSTDGTFEEIQRVQAECGQRLTVLPPRVNQGLGGIAENYNRAIKACTGRYVAFLEGDDVYRPGKLAAQVAWCEADERRVLCGHDVEAFDSATGETLYYWAQRFGLRSGEGPTDVLRHGVPFCTVSVMVRRSAIPSWGFDTRLTAVLDWKFWIDCLIGGGRFGFVEGTLARYRRHPGSLTAGYSDTRQGDQFATIALVAASHPELFRACCQAEAHLSTAVGIQHLQRGDAAAARHWLAKAFRLAPATEWRAGLLGVAAAVAPRWARHTMLARDARTLTSVPVASGESVKT